MKPYTFKTQMLDKMWDMRKLIDDNMEENTQEDIQLQTTLILKLMELNTLISKIEPRMGFAYRLRY